MLKNKIILLCTENCSLAIFSINVYIILMNNIKNIMSLFSDIQSFKNGPFK